MPKPKHFYVYIMTNNQRSHVLYTGITGDLPRRIFEHKHKLTPGFTSRYNLTAWSTAKCSATPATQSKEKKKSKAGYAANKIKLIESTNPHWHDLAADWENLYKPVDRTPVNPRQILRGLAATQDDVKNKLEHSLRKTSS